MDNNLNRAMPTTAQAKSLASTYFLAKVFNWMAIGLGLTGLTAMIVANVAPVQRLIFGNPIVLFGLFFGELGLVFYLSARIQKITAQRATSLFMLYSILNGATLSGILLVYTKTSVAAAFFIAGGMFAAMAVYGTVTKRDLSGMGSFLFMGLIGMIIASVVNMFLGNAMIQWVVSAIGVLVFTGLTAYDVQQLTQMGENGIMESGEAAVRKFAIIGALRLYLDFINLFISLLQLLGDRR